MPEVVEVRFKGNRKAFFSWDDNTELSVGDPVIVQLERGEDLGYVSAVGSLALKKCGSACDGCGPTPSEQPQGRIRRQASTHDTHLSDELRKKEEEVRQKVIERVQKHGLAMKVSDAEWQWDRKKLTIYFTAEHRVDFRALVRDLASLFRTRIELRQIGARDEAKRLAGVGRCGREYCCTSWLPELKPVSLSLAKDQRLSLNPSQISGGCGRLLCCLRYEHEFYVSNRKRFPKEGKTITTGRGTERVCSVDIFRERVTLQSPDGSLRTVALVELKEETKRAPRPPETAEKIPSALLSFDEGESQITPEKAAEAVNPTGRGRRKKRGRRKRKRPNRNGGEGRQD